mmetsp:Transcript_29085/g.94966  ORF Transcript_29085/g.94966 Transcript_29085/m.94966 type:complete len:221 (+) Transcript_29085:1465-2127(+)
MRFRKRVHVFRVFLFSFPSFLADCHVFIAHESTPTLPSIPAPSVAHIPSMGGSSLARRAKGGAPLPDPRTRPSSRRQMYTVASLASLASASWSAKYSRHASTPTGVARYFCASFASAASPAPPSSPPAPSTSSSCGCPGVVTSGTMVTPRRRSSGLCGSADAIAARTSSVLPATTTTRAKPRISATLTTLPFISSIFRAHKFSSRDRRFSCRSLAFASPW